MNSVTCGFDTRSWNFRWVSLRKEEQCFLPWLICSLAFSMYGDAWSRARSIDLLHDLSYILYCSENSTLMSKVEPANFSRFDFDIPDGRQRTWCLDLRQTPDLQ